MFTDTHAHISIHDNIQKIILNAENLNVKKIINNGCDYQSNQNILEISSKYKNIYSAIGIHPQNLNDYQEKYLDHIIKNMEKIVAIGEIGLDYYNGHENREFQKEIFIKQLELAERYNKPVIIHSREATQDTIKILKKFPKVKGSIHCFSGSYETALEYIKMGYVLGINGVVTFKNSNLYKVIEKIPLENIILETDSPYLTPEPYRGKTNEPAFTYYVAKKISEIKTISIEEVSKITESNVKRVFDI